MSARYRKDKKTFQVLLEHGADPNLRDKDPGFAPLHYVATYRYPADTAPQETRELALVELANLLATHKADLNLLSDNKRQQSALHLAILNHHVKLVDFLLNQGADIHSQDAKNTMPLGMAAESGNIEMMEYLMSKGADIMKSRALFHAAACGKSIEPLKLLISKGADINMPDSAGYTPLFPAISAYSLDNVKLLLDSGADKNMYSPKGLTVREHAFASWGEVESVSDTKMAEERRRNADNARDIIMLLGGFDR
jgi:ankyrin repeat protein